MSLFRLELDKDACIECGKCSKICPVSLDVPREIDSLECIRCLECVGVCPIKIIKVKKPAILSGKALASITEEDIKTAEITKVE